MAYSTNNRFRDNPGSPEKSDTGFRTIIIAGAVFVLLFSLFGSFSWGKNKGVQTGIIQGEVNGFSSGKEEGLEIGEQKGFLEAHKKSVEKYLKTKSTVEMDAQRILVDLNEARVMENLIASGNATSINEQDSLFGEALYDTHVAVLKGVLEEAGLGIREKQAYLKTYDELHVGLVEDYRNTFNKKLELQEGNKTVFDRKAYNAANGYQLTVSEGMCHVFLEIGALLITKNVVGATAGEFILHPYCLDIVNAVAPQLDVELKEYGIWMDMQTLKLQFDGYTRKTIAEVATIQDVIEDLRTEIKIEKQVLKKKTFLDSEATVVVEGSALIKAGIDIDDYFELNLIPDSLMLEIVVHEPKILSEEIRSEVVEMEDGYLVGVNKEMINNANKKLKLKLQRRVEEEGILIAAKESFEQFFEAMILPSLQIMGIKNVKYKYVDPSENRGRRFR